MEQLANDLQDVFTSAAQVRGEALFRRGQVRLSEVGGGPPWYAQVQGGRLYGVTIDPDDVELGVCTCPAFDTYGPCKHMWAAILAIQHAHSPTSNGPSAPPARARLTLPTESERRQLARLDRLQRERTAEPAVRILEERLGQVHYVLTPPVPGSSGIPSVYATFRHRLVSGKWSVPKPLDQAHRWNSAPSAEDLTLLHQLGAYRNDHYWSDHEFTEYELSGQGVDELVLSLVRTGRLYLAETHRIQQARKLTPLLVDPLDPITVTCEVIVGHGLAALVPGLHREGDPTSSDSKPWAIRCVVGERLLIRGAEIASWQPAPGSDPEVIRALLADGPLEVPEARAPELAELATRRESEIPTAASPVAQVHLDQAIHEKVHGKLLRGTLSFDYSGTTIEADSGDAVLAVGGTSHRRDLDGERALLDRFERLGGVLHQDEGMARASLPAAHLVRCVRDLLADGFEVYAARLRVQTAGTPQVRVASGVDWFDVHGHVAFAGEEVALPRLLGALQRGKTQFVRIGNNSVGLLPDRDLSRLQRLAEIGTAEGDVIRFPQNQGWLLDALLEGARDDEKITFDRGFQKLRDNLRRGLVAKPKKEPKGFGATLRPYQRDGLGWFAFLQKLGVGGCLADDMGLGKTVQVLALLEQRRRARPSPGPSLVVAPRSLLHHWRREAERFAPRMRTLLFVGARRFAEHADSVEQAFRDHDMVITTFGTLRKDAPELRDVEWDYVVLDEAQAVKNERSQASRAVRLCRARHRLALSGTPIENHLGELWALFEFLNPGMLGRSKVFRKLVSQAPDDSEQTFTHALRRAVRPFMLRRTKAQVLTDLPPKTEQVLECPLPTAQRRAYDELARHYRRSLLGEIDDADIPDKMRFQVLEALLRLRQAACHPGLLDEGRAAEDCAKFEVLWPMLEELRGEGHKALVFSQFPSFLRLLRQRLEEAGVEYAWLDGRTRKRQAQVDRFQSDPECPLFLISLKAGGHGLNLTAASYVFLLDPWWNPAAEAQAIDRTHRIGQDKKVHAYRLICPGTVEERVAELQASKRALADAVLGDDRSLLQELSARDLAFLLR